MFVFFPPYDGFLASMTKVHLICSFSFWVVYYSLLAPGLTEVPTTGRCSETLGIGEDASQWFKGGLKKPAIK